MLIAGHFVSELRASLGPTQLRRAVPGQRIQTPERARVGFRPVSARAQQVADVGAQKPQVSCWCGYFPGVRAQAVQLGLNPRARSVFLLEEVLLVGPTSAHERIHEVEHQGLTKQRKPGCHAVEANTLTY